MQVLTYQLVDPSLIEESDDLAGETDLRLRTMIDAAADFAIFWMSPAGLIESWNVGAERIEGYPASEIVGRSMSLFYTDDDQLDGKPTRMLRFAAEAGRCEDEVWRVRKDGSRFWAHVVIEAIRDSTGTLIGFANVTRNISVHREVERTEEQLFESQRLEIIGQLTGSLAHDFNNLLTGIFGCLDLVRRGDTDERVARLIDTASNAALRGQKQVAQLLAFARQQTLHPQPSQLNRLIEVLEALLKQAGGEAITLRLELDQDLRSVSLDQAQFQSALMNLVLNARDAMPAGGLLTIRTRNLLTSEGAAAAGLMTDEDRVVVEVQDTGVGMAAKVRERAVEPFFTTKEFGRGSGLGLSQVYGFAMQSGGQLAIDSVPGKGTTVRVVLPALTERLAIAPTNGIAARRGVLVVEDNADVLTVAVEMLSAQGYEVYTAENAADALTILQRETPIDVLFTDIVMPGGTNGVDLARRAIDLRPNLSVLLASGYPADALRSQHRFNDEIAFVAKPYRLTTLNTAIDRLLHRPGGDEADDLDTDPADPR